MRQSDPACPVRRKRVRLLRHLPDFGTPAGGSGPVAAHEGRLAAYPRGTRGEEGRGRCYAVAMSIETRVAVLPSACPLDCPDACSLAVQVEDGKVVKLDADGRNEYSQ